MPWERNEINMNTLLLFFALPIATIILAIVLQKILNSPLLVAATFFAIYLIVTFAAFDADFLVYAIAYTILAYITALLVNVICRFIKMLANQNNCTYRITERPITISTNLSSDGNDLTSNTTLLTSTNATSNNNSGGCRCNCRRR